MTSAASSRADIFRLIQGAYTRICSVPCTSRSAYLLAAGIGAALATHVFGWSFVLGTSSYWSFPPGDTNMQLAGYQYFVRDSWHWPLLRTTLISGPEGINVLQLDTIPIVAIIGKLWNRVTGQITNLYGAWMVLCYALQGVFAARLIRAMGERTLIGAVVASILALTAPAFLLRFYRQGLCAQFLTLWALALYFELGQSWNARRAVASFATVLVGALLCHPYLAAMSLPIVVATLLRGALRRSLRDVLTRLALLPVIIGAVVLTALATGHISSSVFKGQSDGYGGASLNLVSPFVPLPGRSMLWSEAPNIQEATGLQWDGAFFLGFGALALLLVHLLVSGRRLLEHAREHAALLVFLLGLTVYAVSNRVYFSTTLVTSWSIPTPLLWVTSQFRSTGRIFWPVGYFILIATIALTLKRFDRALGVALAAACAMVHLLDARPCMDVVGNNTAAPWTRWLDWSEWQPVIAAHTLVRQIPSFDCDASLGLTRVGFESREVQFMAALVGRPINGMRTARPSANCAEEQRRYAASIDEPGVLTLHPRVRGWQKRPSCIAASTFFACSDLLERDPSLLRTARADLTPSYALGSVIDFDSPGDPSHIGFSYLDSEWGLYTGDRIFTGANDAHLRLRVSPEKPTDYDLVLHMEATFAPTQTATTLHVLARDVEIGSLTFTPQDNAILTERSLRLPSSLVPGGEVRLTFRVDGRDEKEPSRGPTVALYRFSLR